MAILAGYMCRSYKCVFIDGAIGVSGRCYSLQVKIAQFLTDLRVLNNHGRECNTCSTSNMRERISFFDAELGIDVIAINYPTTICGTKHPSCLTTSPEGNVIRVPRLYISQGRKVISRIVVETTRFEASKPRTLTCDCQRH